MDRGYIKIEDKKIEFPKDLLVLDRQVLLNMLDMEYYPNEERSLYLMTELIEVYIPDSVRVIDEKAFESCSKLRRVIISEENSLKYIETCAFLSCSELRYFDFEFCNNLRLIDNSAFRYTKIKKSQLDEIPINKKLFVGEDIVIEKN